MEKNHKYKPRRYVLNDTRSDEVNARDRLGPSNCDLLNSRDQRVKGAGAYSASKHGVLGLIKTYSEEYIGGPITFNAICPGYVNTPIIDNNIKAMMSKGISENDAQKLMVNSNPHKN